MDSFILREIKWKKKEKEKTEQGSVHFIIKVLGATTKIDKEAFVVNNQLPLRSAGAFKLFKIGETLSPNTTIPLSDSEYTIDFGWDNPKFEFEIGLAAFNDKLNLIDYVYHFRPSGLNYAIKYSGDDILIINK